jgi:hypothetical protein
MAKHISVPCSEANCGENFPRCGRLNTYRRWGCRCDLCKKTQVKSDRQRRLVRYNKPKTGEEPWHGTESGYSYHGCRCDACLRAALDHNLAGRHKRANRHTTGDEAWHGTPSGYSDYLCRCDPCKKAMSEYVRNHKAKLKDSISGDEAWHGTAKGYSYHGCRCELCTDAVAEFNFDSRKKRSAIPKTGDEPWHGSQGGYTNHGCRCELCRDKGTAQVLSRRQVNRDRVYTGDESWHGTVNGYANYLCRCEDCVLAQSLKNQQWRMANPEQMRILRDRRSKRLRDAFVEDVNHMEIFERDGYICHICGQSVDPSLSYPDPMSASLDHVIPLAAGTDAGGWHSKENLSTSHLRCNLRKGARHEAEGALGRGSVEEDRAN